MIYDSHCHLDLMDNMTSIVQSLAKEDIGILSVGTTPRAYLKEVELFSGVKNVHVALGYSSEVITIFYVDGLEYAGEQNPDEDEFINLKKYKVEDALRLLDDNTITDSKTMLALMYLKIRKGTK